MKFAALKQHRSMGRIPYVRIGRRKVDHIILSMVGKITPVYGLIGHVIRIKDKPNRYDLKALIGMDVILTLHSQQTSEMSCWIDAIIDARPAHLFVWIVDQGFSQVGIFHEANHELTGGLWQATPPTELMQTVEQILNYYRNKTND